MLKPLKANQSLNKEALFSQFFVYMNLLLPVISFKKLYVINLLIVKGFAGVFFFNPPSYLLQLFTLFKPV